MSRLKWLGGLAPAFLVAAVGFGCGGSTPQVSSPVSADVGSAETPGPVEEDESTEDLREHHRHHHHGGIAMFIAISLDSLGTTPEQSAAITKIREELHEKMQAAHDAEKRVLLTLADGIAVGNIDQGKVEAAIAQLSTESAGVHDAVAGTLNELHATLTPAQRLALVDKLEAHLDVWDRENSPEESAQHDRRGAHLAKLAKELGLTPDQTETIRASLKSRIGSAHFERAEADEHLRAFGDAFASDTFDARTMATIGPVNAHMATWGVRRMAHLYEAATPVLTSDQRAKLSDILRRHANYKRTPSGR